MRKILKKITACILAGAVSISSLPVSASTISDQDWDDSISEQMPDTVDQSISESLLDENNDVTGVEEILGSRYLETSLEDGTGISLTAEEDMPDNALLKAYNLRTLEEMQSDYESGITFEDRYSLDDIESMLYDEMQVEDGQRIVVDPAFDIYVEDENGYEVSMPNNTKVSISFPFTTIDGIDGSEPFDKTEDSILYHLRADGTWEQLDMERKESEYSVTFHTDSFSPFVFVHVEAETEEFESETNSETEPVIEESQNEQQDDSAVIPMEIPNDESVTAESESDISKEEVLSEPDAQKETESVSDKTELNDIEKESLSSSEDAKTITEENTSEKAEGMVEIGPDNEQKLLSDKMLTRQTRDFKASSANIAPETQEPVTGDGMTIEKIVIKWLSNSTGSDEPAGYGRLNLIPTDDDVAAQQWQLDFALSGKHEHEEGSIEIVMPAHIWLDRDGEEPGILTLSVPEDPETGGMFSWRRRGDTIVFTNTRNISAAAKLMIQGSFRQMKAHDMVDIDVAEGSVYNDAACKGVSSELYATINVVVPNKEVISMTSNTIDASINTHVEAASAAKTAYNPTTKEYYLYWNIPSNIPSDFLPENAEDYVYVRWFVTGQAQGNQPYSMTVTDNANDEYGCRILGVEDANGVNIKSEDGQTVTAELFSGYNTQLKSAYVWTAYEKSYFTEEMHLYTVHNSQTITVTGIDDMVVTTKEADAEASLALPIEYTVIKEWDDNDNELGVRPDHQDVEIYRNPEGDNKRELWKTVRLTEANNWSYTWSDEGKAWHYETKEINMASGSFETWYDEDGQYHTTSWRYHQKKKTYDPDTRTWVFVNILTIQGKNGDMHDMWKRVHWQYDDPYQRSTRDRALNKLLHGQDAIVPYDVWGISGNFQAWADCMTAGDIFAHRVNVILEDNQHTDTEYPVMDPVMMNNKRVTDVTDYELAYADIEMPKIYGYTRAVRDPSLPENDPRRYYEDRFVLAKYIDKYTDATFEGLINGEWVVLGELHNGELTGQNGGTFNGTKLTFPDGVTQFREIVNSFGAATELKYEIGVKVHPSEFVLEQINTAAALSDYMMMTVDNYARLYEHDEGMNKEHVSDESPFGQLENWELSDWDRGYLHGRIYRVAAYQTKQFELTGNDTLNKTLTLHTTAESIQQSNVLTRAEYNKAVKDGDIPYTTGGTWYDLLPPGVEPLVDTVKLQDSDQKLDSYTIENYKGSGRTLLVVKAKLGDHVTYTRKDDPSNPYSSEKDYPKEGYKQIQKIEFDATYSWADAKVYGLDGVRNTICFQSDDVWVGNLNGWEGETDDPRSGGNKWTEESVRSDLDLMTNLTSKSDDTPSFIYAGAPLIYENPDYMAETSIRKWVSAEGTGIWSYGHNNEAIVYEGGKYKYRIDLTGDSETETKDIIMLDSLENYIPTADKVDDYGDHQWRGYFRSIDVSGLKRAGIEPIVYYSTVPNLDISKTGGYNPADEKEVIGEMLLNAVTNTGEKVWSTELPEDPGTVTAYAIDCRKRTDGSDFTLSSGQTVSFQVFMKAPQEEAARPIWCAGTGKKANPDPALRDETNPDDNAHAYNNVYLDSTQVDGVGRETHAYIHWDYVKVGIVPFHIFLQKEWDDMENRDGKRPEAVTVHLLKDGEDTGRTVTLDESNDWSGEFKYILRYDEDNNWIDYSFSEEEVSGYTMSYSKNGKDVYILNTHEPEKITVPFTKKWEGDTESVRPESITVKLFADGVYTGEKKTVTANADGIWEGEFKDLFRYKDGQEIQYTVEEEAVDNYIVSYGQDEDIRTITNTYHPYNDLNIEKHLKNATEAAKDVDFTFTLVLKDSEGNSLTDKYDYETSDGRTGKIKSGDSFTLKGGQTISVKDIPTHTLYSVEESTAKGFTLTSKDGDKGTIVSYAESTAFFTNTYASKGSVALTAQKYLNGRALELHQFRFQVNEMLADGTDLGAIRMITNTADGSVIFGGIRYTEADDGIEHIYKISEVDTEKSGYSYDHHPVYVKVIPTDNGNGTMTCTPVYYDENWNELKKQDIIRLSDGHVIRKEVWNGLSSEEQEALNATHAEGQNTETESIESLPATFINDYRANGSIVLRAWKQLTGRSLEEGEFTFDLYDEDGNLVHTATNLADGSIVFDPVAFTEKDAGKEFHFFVTEKIGSDETVNYDDSVFGYEVHVIDKGDGTLQFSQTQVNAHKAIKAIDNNTPLLVAREKTIGFYEYPRTQEQIEDSFESYLNQEIIDSMLASGWFSSEENIEPEIKAELTELLHVDQQVLKQNPKVMRDITEIMPLDTNSFFKYITVTCYDDDYHAQYDDSFSYNQVNSYDNVFMSMVSPGNEMYQFLLNHPTGTYACLGDMVGYNGSRIGELIQFVEIETNYEEIYIVDGSTNDVPVFQNSLKDGSLTVSKFTTWQEGDEPDPNTQFHFKVKLIRPDGKPFEDGELEYNMEQIENIGAMSGPNESSNGGE